ncbi:hypothetical protein AAW12_11095 [Sphingobacterium sp. Ag1]|uniref:DUF6443 domain-containing protein n=1 Tax=Sphingobacterium sp. Ag1 TaxID=1643451 RepID=UPI0006281262|nr:DUF6443 domain-containing protein [Sphingobacterium sp. Ag1]KKO91325.1 hypothetical protein AAW12_11095 [Sphingobacterium sp. Ag1]
MNTKNIILYLIGACLSSLYVPGAKGQTLSQNFVQQDIVTVSGVKTIDDVLALDYTKRMSTRSYLDGFGRPIQTVQRQASPLGKDIVQTISYDKQGRQEKEFMPFQANSVTGEYRSNAAAEQQSFYATSGQKIANDTKPYTSRLFEKSPLSRLLEMGTTGDGFQPGQHSTTYSYRSNTTADAVRRWNADGTAAANFAPGALRVAETQAADGQKTQLFTDRAGNTVLRRSYINETVEGQPETWLDTYYVYDDLGQARYVVPPKAVTAMRQSGNWTLTQSSIIDQIYSYRYNNKRQVVEKREPATGDIYYIYDPLDRVVLVQDARIRASNKWYYIKYDARNVAVSQGMYTNTVYTTRATMQSYVQGLSYAVNRSEKRINTAATGYYSNLVFPTTAIEPLSYVYFDDYDLDRNGTADYSYAPQGLQDEMTATGSLQGRQTVLRQRSLGDGLADIWLTSVCFYSKKGDVIQIRANNHLNTALEDSETKVVDFAGKTLRKRTVRKVPSAGTLSTITVDDSYQYDHAARLLYIDEKYNSGSSIRIASYSYNEMGQLIDKKLHSTNSGSTFLQSVDYRYNIRGQLLSINSSNLGTGDNNDDGNDLFGMELLYDKVDAALGNTAFYSGRISAVKWRAKTASDNNPKEKSYLMGYDLQDRMKSAQYRDRLGAAAWGNIGSFDEKGLTYDANGNLMTLQRTALISGVNTTIDDISYSYTGDKMTNVSEGTTGSLGTYGFRNLTGSTAAYSYDAVGAIAADPKKGLSFAYNVLGLTAKTTITTATNRYVDYTYTASGTLLRTRHYDGGTLVKTLDYIGGFVYENGAISYFSMVEGRVRNVGGVLKPEYMLKDHQGNVRVSFEEQSGVAVVRQENSYYPFGLQFPGTVIPSGANRNLYNGGSEWENAFSNLPDLYRTDHRMYDPALGRFLSPDPLALSSAGYGTYHYAYNNPLLFNDPLGLKAAPGSGGGITGPYGEFWNYVMSFTAGNGAYITPAKNGWDVAEFSSSEAAFYFASSMMTENNSWGSYSGWAGSYETAAARYNANNVGQVAEKFYRLNEVAVDRRGFNSGSWISQAYAQHKSLWSSSSKETGSTIDPHADELAKYGQISWGYNFVAGASISTIGGNVEIGTLITDKGWARNYKTVYYSPGFASPSVSHNFFFIYSTNNKNLPTFSDWNGLSKGMSASFDFVSIGGGIGSNYAVWSAGLSFAPASLNFMKESRGAGALNVGVTTWIGPVYMLPGDGSTQRYINTMKFQGGY